MPMAKEWAKAFYRSGAWKAARKEALHRDMYTCTLCGRRAEEVHHKIELTPQNIGDPSISLNVDRLESLCHECHTKVTQQKMDCDAGFYFDGLGQLTPRGGVKN